MSGPVAALDAVIVGIVKDPVRERRRHRESLIETRDAVAGLIDQVSEMKQRACRAHALCNELRLAHPEIPELGDDGVLHEAIHDILRVDTPTAAPARAAKMDGDQPLIQFRKPKNEQEVRLLLEFALDQATRLNVRLGRLYGTAPTAGPVAQATQVESDADMAKQVLAWMTRTGSLSTTWGDMAALSQSTAEPVAQGEAVPPKPIGTQLELIAHCPFCGCEADLRLAPNDYATNGGEVGLPHVDSFFVHCDGCGCDGPVGESDPNARDLWNDRAAQPRAVPDGLVSVPREPSRAMKHAGKEATHIEDFDTLEAECVYKAMLAAAPSPGESA